MPKKTLRALEPGLLRAIEIVGSHYRLAKKLGISGQAIQQWRTVPARWIVPIEEITGVPREELRPELYRR